MAAQLMILLCPPIFPSFFPKDAKLNLLIDPMLKRVKFILYLNKLHAFGSLGIAHTRNCTQFLKLDSWSPGEGFYSYYIHQGNKSDKERKIVRKSPVLYIQKDLIYFLKMCAIPCR